MKSAGLAQQSPEITNNVEVIIDQLRIKCGNMHLSKGSGALSQSDVAAYRPAAQSVERSITGGIRAVAAQHEANEQLSSSRMLAALYPLRFSF